MDNDSKETMSISNVLKAIPIFSAYLLVLSVIYNWFYFRVIGIDLLGSLTISDHISHGITFLPGYIIAILFISLFRFYVDLGLGESSEKETKLRRISGSIINSALYGIVTFSILSFYWKYSLAIIFVLFIILLMNILRSFLHRKALVGTVALNISGFISGSAIAVAAIGYVIAVGDLSSRKFPYAIETVSTVYPETRILRFLGEGLIVYDGDELRFIPDQHLVSVVKNTNPAIPESILCVVFGLNCRNIEDATE